MRLILLLPSFPTLTTRSTILHVLVIFYKDAITETKCIDLPFLFKSVREMEPSSTDAISIQDLFKPEVGLQLKRQIAESRMWDSITYTAT